MKILLFASALLLAISTSSFAQDESGAAYSKGQNTVTIGYGLGNIWKNGFKALTAFNGGSTKVTGPFALCYENGIAEHISVGVCISYSSYIFLGYNSNASS